MKAMDFWLVLFGVVLMVLPLIDAWNANAALVFCLIWWGIIIFLTRKYDVQILSAVVFLVLVIQAQWGLAQFIRQDDLGLYLIGETRLDVTESGIAKFSLNQDKLVRAYGPYPHPNSFAGGLSMGLLVYVMWLLGVKNKEWLHGGVGNMLLVFLWLGIIVSFSRAAYISSGFTMLLYFVLTRKRINWQWLTLLIIVTFVFLPLFGARFSDVEDRAIEERIVGAKWAGELADWRGVGVGEYREALENYLNENNIYYEPWQIDYVHSVPLLIVVEFGWVVTALAIGGLLLLLRTLYVNKWWWLLPLLPLILLDHYVVTQPATTVLMLTLLFLLYGIPARVVH